MVKFSLMLISHSNIAVPRKDYEVFHSSSIDIYFFQRLESLFSLYGSHLKFAISAAGKVNKTAKNYKI